jgi:cytochrome c biogenesis protein CcmG, thiol:disulfide interchange protein DsbE
MKRSFARSPYLWAILGVVTVVVVAWVGRENYQPVLTGAVAPDFTAKAMDGSDVAISDYEGKVLLVNIWATWCGPCLEEMPSMQRLYEELEDKDFEILAISIDAPFGQDDAFGRAGGDLDAFAKDLGLTFPILHNPEGDVQRVYQTTGVPETFLLGKDGVIYKKVSGGTDWDAPVNMELVLRLLGK